MRLWEETQPAPTLPRTWRLLLSTTELKQLEEIVLTGARTDDLSYEAAVLSEQLLEKIGERLG